MVRGMDIAFALNYTNLYMIDIDPTGESPVWARVGAGITTVSVEGNDVTTDDNYYDGDGMASTDVTGGQIVLSFSGHRKYGDPAQDFIDSIAAQYGQARHTNLKRIAPNGDVFEGDVTIANIQTAGGDANSKGDFSFDARFNGMPTITEGNATEFPTAITASAVTVKVGATAPAGATVTPTTASSAMLYAIEDDTIATVDADGNVKGVKAGKTNLSIKSAVLPSVRKEIEVTVTTA